MKVMERGEIIADFCHIFECKLQIKRKMKRKQEGTTEKTFGSSHSRFVYGFVSKTLTKWFVVSSIC